MKQTKLKKGYLYEREDCDIIIKDTESNTKNDIITIVPKKDKVKISAAELTTIIVEGLKTKSFLLHLKDMDLDKVYMTETERTLYFRADRDIKEGETFTIPYRHMYPFLLAKLEEGYGLAKIAGQVEAVSDEYLKKAEETLLEKNRDFVEKIYKAEIAAIEENKKNKSVAGGKDVEEN